MADIFPNRPPLAVGSIGVRSSGFAGMALLVLSESAVFIYMFFAYYYFSVQPHGGPWPPGGPPSFLYSAPQSAVMVLGCASMWWANRSADNGNRFFVLIGLAITFILSLGFIVLQFLDWYAKPFSLATGPYSSFYFVITGTHLVHIVAGALMIAAVLVWSGLGYFGRLRHAPITIAALYWYFLTVAWLWLFFTIYGTPRLT